MHRLVPDFILRQYADGQLEGRFNAAALFVDIAGFSAITDALMQRGQQGAEVLADLMRIIFDPLVRSVYQHGGFVVGFAGDAFTALFPQDDDAAPAARAVTAAWAGQTIVQQNADLDTEFGRFTFAAKMGIGVGTAEWGILAAPDDSRAVYFFRGSAIAESVAAEHVAGHGAIILSTAVRRALGDGVVVEPVADCYQLKTPPSLTQAKPLDLPPVDVNRMSAFFPRRVITQPFSGEFRHVFNLFISLAGRPDRNQLTRFMQVLFELQARYGGLLNRIDFADKGCHLLLFWGAPRANENDISRILNFMLDLRQQSSIPLRAGVTYRIAHAGFVGSSLHEEYTCYGRGVNLAARFMTTANWGDIWLDEDVAQRAHDFQVDALGEQPFKGFSQPQAVYALRGRKAAVKSTAFQRRIVGRRAELAQLESVLIPLRERRFGGVFSVIGEAGIGKSHLVNEFLETGELADFASIFLCQTDEIMRQSLNPFRYWLRDYFEQSPDKGEAANKRRFDGRLADLTADATDPALRADLEHGRSFLGALVDLSWPHSLYAQLEPQMRFENTLTALKALVKAESRRRPALLVVEDGQWLDEDSARFLRRLTRNVADFPFAVLLTSRAPLPAGFLEEDVAYHALQLSPLTDSAVGHLAEALLGREPTPELHQFILDRTDGNPYFVEQLLLYLRENDLLQAMMTRAGLRTSDSLIPTDVQAVLVARLDRFAAPVREVVQTAAVLGREFERPILAHTFGQPGQLQEPLARATAAAIWQPLDERRYWFHHALMRDAAYNMQILSRLRRLHHRAAIAYETGYRADLTPSYSQIAYHYDRAQVVAKALDYYERAAHQARDNYQNEEALSYYQRALALVDSGDLDCAVRLLLGQEQVQDWLGRREAQAETLASLADIAAGDAGLRAEVALRGANLARVTNNYDLAKLELTEALTYATETADKALEMKIAHLWGRMLWQQGRYDEARAKHEQALTLAQATGARHDEAQNRHDIGVIDLYQSQFGSAQTQLQRALDIYREQNAHRGEVNCLLSLGAIRRRRGEHMAGHRLYEQALAICQESGWLHGKSFLYSHLGNSYFELGDYQQAGQYHQDALAICRELNDREGEAISLDTLGLIAHQEGQLAAAERLYQAALHIQKLIGDGRGQGYTHTHYGLTLTAMGRYAAAAAQLEQARQMRQYLGETGLIIDCLAGLAGNALAQGDITAAHELVTEAMACIEADGIDGVEFPLRTYLVCYQVLQAAAAERPSLQPQADSVLKAGYERLQERATAIQDEPLRAQFLQNIPANRALAQAWQAQRPVGDPAQG